VADIGADHAYVSILAAQRGAARVYALEANPGPLARARANIAAWGFAETVETRLGWGLGPLAPGEAETLVLAGLGGRQIVEILSAGPQVVQTAAQLVLQPQRDLAAVRRYVLAAGFDLWDEQRLREDGRDYSILNCRRCRRCRRDPSLPYTEAEYQFGKILLRRRDPLLWQYLVGRLAKLRAAQGRAAAPSALGPQLALLEEALAYYSEF
jgi:tRNA (adenine22-N1)-methyltransferase